MSTTLIAANTYGYLLDGNFVAQGKAVDIRAPYDQQIVSTVIYAGKAEAEQAISAAVRAFEVTRKLPTYERRRVLRTISERLRARREEFSRVLALEAGKPIKTARAETDRAIFTFALAAEEAGRIYGEVAPLDLQEQAAGRWSITRRFPLGPIAAIVPFNFPLNLTAHKIAPCIAAGCTMVLKPPPQDPTVALMLAELVQEAGWPAGALNVLPLSNEDAAPLITDDRLKLLTFTGSAAVGWKLKQQAGKKKVVLELGGNAGVIIHSDADLAYAAQRCAIGGFAYAGQSCIAVQRILVERSVYPRFTELLVERACKLKLGDPLDDTTDLGPLIREQDAVRAGEWVEEAVRGGAKLLCGGERRGPLMQPTVLTGTQPSMRVNCQEIFAPVVTVEPYDDFQDAVRQANDTVYGLQAGVFTRDARLLFHAFEELQVGGVIAGDIPSFRMDQMPYGGIKESGLGREGLRYAIEDMTELKLLVLNIR